jgi:hypothetical protein
MSLTTRVTNDYNNWTKGADWALYGSNAYCKLVSPNGVTEYNEDIKKSFALTNPAHQSQLSFKVNQIWENEGSGILRCKIIIKKPDTSEVTLYDSQAQTGGFIDALYLADINSSLDQSGTYYLILRGDVQSLYDDPVWDNNEVHGWTVLLSVDDTKPSQITGVSAHAESTSSIHVLWTADGEATQYYVYYKKTTDPSWNYVSVNAPTVEKIITSLDSGVMYDIKVSGYNLSGEGTASTTVQMRPLGTMTQNLSDTVTPTESLATNRIVYRSFSEDIGVTETFAIQRLTSTPTSTSILICGSTNSHVYTFATALPPGIFDTPDVDFGYPEHDKTLTEIRFGSESETPHTILVYVSLDSGSTWTLIDSDTIYLGKTGYVFPWVTSKRFLIRFSGSGLRLYFYEIYAIPAGWTVKTP